MTFSWEEFKNLQIDDTLGNTLTLICFLAILLTHFLIKNPKQNKLGFSYWWYLLNAYFFHWYMDVLGGFYGYIKPTFYLYRLMDSRYSQKDPIISFICQMEIYVMGPLCLIVAILFKTNRNILRIVLSVIVSVVQLFGTIIYFVEPIKNQFTDFYCQPSCFSFTPENLFFFWFACCVTNPWWVYVPIKELFKAYDELKQLTDNNNQKTKKNK